MGTRSRAVVAAFVFVASVGGSRLAAADPKGDINAKVKEAMESYDLMDYDAAKKALKDAAALAKKAKLERDAVAAKVWLDLGIVDFAVPDPDGAKQAFATAVSIDPKIQIDPAYKSPDMAKLLDEARKGAKSGPAAPPPTGPDIDVGEPAADCGSVKGLQHNIIDSSRANAPAKVEAMLGSDVAAAKVSLMYRAEGGTDFTEVKMTKSGCKYTGAIPASATHGSVVHYYVAAYDSGNKVLAAKGSQGSPNIMELTGGGPVKSDEEDPLGKSGGGGGGSSDTGDGIGKSVTPDDKSPKKLSLGVNLGTGFGYVTGTTENNLEKVTGCCVGASLAVIMPELAYAVSPKAQVGVVVRLGIPVGANIDGHATMAPAGLVRLRYSLGETAEGVHVLGQAGVGILRNTLKLNDGKNGMDTDIVAQGPLLIGGGVGYTKRLSNSVSFLFDVTAIAGIAVVKSFGSAPALNTGVSADVSLGLAVGL